MLPDPEFAYAWANRIDLFVSIPSKAGKPVICRYPLTTSGLADALNILVRNSEPTPRTISEPPPTPNTCKIKEILKRILTGDAVR